MYRQVDQTPLAADPFSSRLANQYDLNIAVLGNLGFSEQEIEADVPPFETIRGSLSPSDKRWINEQVSLGYAARLTIAPSVRRIGLEGDRYAPGLIPRFDIKQEKVKRGNTIVSRAWRAYGDKYPVHDNGLNERFSAAILLKPTARTELSDKAEASPPEQVLRSNASISKKIDALRDEHIEQSQHGRWVVSAPIGHLVSDEAQSRYAGERSFHHYGASCLAHYPLAPNRRADSLPTLSRGGRHNQRIELGERMLFVANEVVLRVLHIPVSLSEQQKA